MSFICGVLGEHGTGPGAEQAMARMLAAGAARGPDGAATFRDEAQAIFLGLCLLRATRDGARPMVLSNEDGSILMVCDGQVFNGAELRALIVSRGHAPRTESACEALIHLYEDEGPTGLRRADGQFALALWDGRKRQLVLARDFLGVCPLYYHASRQGVVFASEIKAVLQHPAVTAAVDEIAASHYLTFLAVPGPRTLFAGVHKLPAGSFAICTGDGPVQVQTYWDLLQDPIPEVEDERFYVERARELHRQAVARRAVEGPIGALLSGGNDSSANVALLAQQGCAPLHTFTVGLRDVEGKQAYNDLEYARRVAALARTEHHEDLLSVDQFLDIIPLTVDALDDLVSEPSSVFLYQALRLAREQGLRVVITGEANDELSCGHGEMIRIRQGYYQRWLPVMRLPRLLRRALAAAAPLLSPARTDILRRAASDDEYFWNFETAWMDSNKDQILTPEAWQRCRGEGAREVVRRYAQKVRASEHGKRDYLNYMIYVMMQDYYFGNLMLGKLDLLAGSLGLEPRCPYTEPAYAHFVYNIPARFKFRGDTVKYFFKKAISGLLPDEIIYRPKQGFRTPVVELFQGRLGDWARPVLLDGGLTQAGFLRRDHLAGLLERHRQGVSDHSNALWTAMVLNLWHERWIRPRARAAAHAELPVVAAGPR